MMIPRLSGYWANANWWIGLGLVGLGRVGLSPWFPVVDAQVG